MNLDQLSIDKHYYINTKFLRTLCRYEKSVAVLAQRGVVARLNEGSTLALYIDSAVMEGTAR